MADPTAAELSALEWQEIGVGGGMEWLYATVWNNQAVVAVTWRRQPYMIVVGRNLQWVPMPQEPGPDEAPEETAAEGPPEEPEPEGPPAGEGPAEEPSEGPPAPKGPGPSSGPASRIPASPPSPSLGASGPITGATKKRKNAPSRDRTPAPKRSPRKPRKNTSNEDSIGGSQETLHKLER